MEISSVIIGVVILTAVYALMTYNSLVGAKVRVGQSLKDIDVQLKKRYDLLPDLIETVKKSTGLDEKIFTEVTRLRTQAMEAQSTGASVGDRAGLENKLSSVVRDIKVSVEAYPDIKSHGELTGLMESVTAIEEKIAYSRQFYNSNVADYLAKISFFPGMLIASSFGFKPVDYFNTPEEEKADVKVNFN